MHQGTIMQTQLSDYDMELIFVHEKLSELGEIIGAYMKVVQKISLSINL